MGWSGESEASGKLVPNDAAIKKFWDHTTAHGWLSSNHPGRNKNPLGLYGDDCRYNKSGEKLLCMNFNIILQEIKCVLTLQSILIFFENSSTVVEPVFNFPYVYLLKTCTCKA